MYRLPNGQVWAEHEDLWDTEDLRSHAASIGKTINGAPEYILRVVGLCWTVAWLVRDEYCGYYRSSCSPIIGVVLLQKSICKGLGTQSLCSVSAECIAGWQMLSTSVLCMTGHCQPEGS